MQCLSRKRKLHCAHEETPCGAVAAQEERLRSALPRFLAVGKQRWLQESECPICLDSITENLPEHGVECVAILQDSPGHSNACRMTLARGACHLACFAEMVRRQVLAPGSVPRNAFSCPMCRTHVLARQLVMLVPMPA